MPFRTLSMLLLLAGFNCHALSLPPGLVEDTEANAKALVLGPPRPVTPEISRDESCISLYEKRLKLTREQLDYRPRFLDDARNQASIGFGMFSSIALGFLPFSTLQAYVQDAHRGQVETDLDALRQASARLQCFRR